MPAVGGLLLVNRLLVLNSSAFLRDVEILLGSTLMLSLHLCNDPKQYQYDEPVTQHQPSQCESTLTYITTKRIHALGNNTILDVLGTNLNRSPSLLERERERERDTS
jgi:hypothetical protein